MKVLASFRKKKIQRRKRSATIMETIIDFLNHVKSETILFHILANIKK